SSATARPIRGPDPRARQRAATPPPPRGRTPSPVRARRTPRRAAPGTASGPPACPARPPGGRRAAASRAGAVRRWATRAAPRSALVGRVVRQPLPERLLILLVRGVVVGEPGLAGVKVDRDEVAPVALGRVEHRLDGR